MSLEEISSLNVLKENEEINCENVKIILTELTEKLKKSKEQLNEVKKRNLPKIREIQKGKKEIYEKIEGLKRELTELNSIKPIFVLEKRKGDFRTEGEYISRILNRNIKEEFVNQMKRELKQLAADEIESFDQILCTLIPGCDELNEKFDESGIEGVFITQKTEKLLTILNTCHNEIVKKVYKEDEKEKEKMEFESFCYEMLYSYFKRRTDINSASSVTSASSVNPKLKTTASVSTTALLPQFFALLLNDLNVSIVFSSIHFKGNSWKLKKLVKEYFEAFLNEQKEEISSLILNDSNTIKSIKRVALFLSRLEKVLKPLMIKIYYKNLQIILLNFAQEIIWKNLIEISEISEDEIENFYLFIKEAIDLDKENKHLQFPHLLKYKQKLSSFQKILKLSLIEIINCYHRREFKEISELELIRILKSIFASSQLRNEFIKELEIDIDFGHDDDDYNDYNDYDCEGDGNGNENEDEYF